MRAVSIVTVSYNSYRCLDRLRGSLLEHTKPDLYEWIIVDNCSTRENTHRLLAKIADLEEARVVHNTQNWWFTAGCNIGISYASGKHILLLNPDCEVKKGWLEEMIELIERPKVGIVGKLLVNEQGACVHAGAVGFGDHVALGEAYNPRAAWAQSRQITDWVTGACLMIRRDALEAVGGKLDETFKHYHGDRALCDAVKEAGYTIWLAAKVPIVHSVGGSAQ